MDPGFWLRKKASQSDTFRHLREGIWWYEPKIWTWRFFCSNERVLERGYEINLPGQPSVYPDKKGSTMNIWKRWISSRISSSERECSCSFSCRLCRSLSISDTGRRECCLLFPSLLQFSSWSSGQWPTFSMSNGGWKIHRFTKRSWHLVRVYHCRIHDPVDHRSGFRLPGVASDGPILFPHKLRFTCAYRGPLRTHLASHVESVVSADTERELETCPETCLPVFLCRRSLWSFVSQQCIRDFRDVCRDRTGFVRMDGEATVPAERKPTCFRMKYRR